MRQINEGHQSDDPNRNDQDDKSDIETSAQISRPCIGDHLPGTPDLIRNLLHSHITEITRVDPDIAITPY
jgi:hypothetical protein